MPDSHRQARDYLAKKAGLPPLSRYGLSQERLAQTEADRAFELRVKDALTGLARIYHARLKESPEVLDWLKSKYALSDETIDDLLIGYADNESGVVAQLTGGTDGFSKRELAATGAFRPTSQDGLTPFFERRIVFPYWSRGPRRVHDRPQDAVDPGRQLGAREIQETAGSRRTPAALRRRLHQQRTAVQRGLSAGQARQGHHHRGGDRLSGADATGIANRFAGHRPYPGCRLGTIDPEAARRGDRLHLPGQRTLPGRSQRSAANRSHSGRTQDRHPAGDAALVGDADHGPAGAERTVRPDDERGAERAGQAPGRPPRR